MIGIILYEYFFIRNCRVRQFQTVYDSFFNGFGSGWIYCTNKITRFQAHLLIFMKGEKLKEFSVSYVDNDLLIHEGRKPQIDIE